MQLVAKPFAELTPEDFEQSWRSTCFGAMVTAQAALPGMLSRGGGTMIFTGATASIKASARFAAFASAKFALRGLAQSLAREFGPQGVHVVHAIIDGIIWGPQSQQRFNVKRENCLEPELDFGQNLNGLAIDPCLSGCHPQPLAVVFGHAHGRSPAWQSSVPAIAPEFQRLFPDDAACAAYLEKARWSGGFVCPHCQAAGEPFRFANRLGVLRCRKCRRDTGLTVGTVIARSHTPLSVWFWSAYCVHQTPGVSAVQLRRQLGLSRYQTAFQILHKLRAGMVRPDQDRIGGRPGEHVEVDETWAGGRTRGKGRGVHDKVLVASAVEVRQRKPGTKLDKRKGGRYAGRVRLAIVPDRSAESLCGFVDAPLCRARRSSPTTGAATPALRSAATNTSPSLNGAIQVAEEYLPIIHLVFANLKTWLNGIHHGVSHQHLQAYLNEFTFRFNRRFYPFNAFRSLLGIAGDLTAPTYAELYSGAWQHPTCWGCG